MPLKLYKYQLIFLGDSDNLRKEIEEQFFKRTNELGLSNDSVLVLDENNFGELYDNKQPAFVYYIGGKAPSEESLDILHTVKENGDPIYPLYFTRDNFGKEIPEMIHEMNGTLFTGDNLESIVGCAMEGLRLLRKSRRVFISYKRSEATGVAQQLFEALTQAGFDPFMDCYSIRPAENFQDELHHRLTDSDVLIQLHTPSFYESKWCGEEIEIANLTQVGVKVLAWPGVDTSSSAHLSYHQKLKEEDFDGNPGDARTILKKGFVDQLISEIESLRARNLAAREDNLVGEFVASAARYGKHYIQEYCYLVEKDETGQVKRLFIPAIGVPHSFDHFQSLEFRKILAQDDLEIFLLYDDLRIRKNWIDHLDWLNKSLEVKSIKRNDFESWIRNQ